MGHLHLPGMDYWIQRRKPNRIVNPNLDQLSEIANGVQASEEHIGSIVRDGVWRRP